MRPPARNADGLTGWTAGARLRRDSRRVEAADWEFELKPGYCLNVAGWVVSKDERMGVWVGDTVTLTDSGVRRLHRSPIDQLAANILAD